MLKRLIGLLAVSLLFLIGCQHDGSPVNSSPEATGEAEIILPDLQSAALQKSGAGANLGFRLSVEGRDGAVVTFSWKSSQLKGQPLKVKGLPVGLDVKFTGQITQKEKVTHSGETYADVHKGLVAQVRLYLHKLDGNAEVCVEVEGLPRPVNCLPPRPRVDLNGCWGFGVLDTSRSWYGQMHLIHNDTNLQAVITWPDTKRDTALGWVRGYNLSTNLESGFNDFELQAGIDSLSSDTLTGYFRHFRRSIEGSFFASRSLCGDYPGLPPIDSVYTPPEDTLLPPLQPPQTVDSLHRSRR